MDWKFRNLLREIISLIRSKMIQNNKEYLALSIDIIIPAMDIKEVYTSIYTASILGGHAFPRKSSTEVEKYTRSRYGNAILPALLSNRNEPRGKLRGPILLPFTGHAIWKVRSFVFLARGRV